jgi:hypothetical protein
MLQVEESLFIDGQGQPMPTLQLVVVGELSAIGGEDRLGSSGAQANQGPTK